jgi:hypothetical protein
LFYFQAAVAFTPERGINFSPLGNYNQEHYTRKHRSACTKCYWLHSEGFGSNEEKEKH